MQHSFDRFHDSSILYLGHTILFWVIWYNGLFYDSSFFVEVNEITESELSSIVRSENFDLLSSFFSTRAL